MTATEVSVLQGGVEGVCTCIGGGGGTVIPTHVNTSFTMSLPSPPLSLTHTFVRLFSRLDRVGGVAARRPVRRDQTTR
jgi:hypothetical protein